MGGKTNTKKLGWEVMLFFALYTAMPSYCAIEFHEKLPLLTASRAVLVLMGVGLLWRRRGDLLDLKQFRIKNWNLQLTESKFLRLGLFGYFFILAFVNCTFLTQTSEAVKQLFVIALEEYALVWMLAMILDSREKIVDALKILAVASGIIAVVSCIGCVMGENLFNYLNTVNRDMRVRDYYRLGMLRASAGFSHAVYYGAFCTMMFPLCMYLVEEGKNRRERILFGLCLALNFVGLVLSNSRGSMLALGCLGIAVILIRIATKSLKKLIVTFLPYGVVALAILALVASFSPLGIRFLGQTVESLMIQPKPTVAVTTPVPTPDTKETMPDITQPLETTVDVTQPAVTTPDVTQPAVTTPDVTQPAVTTPDVTQQPTISNPTQPPETVPEPTEPAPTEAPVNYGENKDGLGSRLDQLTGITWTLTQKPVFGFGPNCHTRGLMAYMYYPGHWSHVKTFDVNIVAIIGQYGLVGLVAFLLLFGTLGITLVRKKYRTDKLMHYLLLAFLAYMLCLLSIASLDQASWILFGLIISLVNIIQREKRDP